MEMTQLYDSMKLDHIQLAMPEGGEEKARAFFAGLLGMVEEEKTYPLSERGGCWFRKGTVILHLGVDEGFIPQKKAHPAFIVPDPGAMDQALRAFGHEVAWDVALPSRKRFYTHDPFGNRIEFIKEGDGFSDK
jgi:catechol 2,3-dioxygenase-like lactoylglutathione lyase family enzyme